VVAPAPDPVAATVAARPPIDLALQGGGSHGAYTWGVLDALLEDDTLQFDGVSGTSAGALNAAVLATGYARGGAAGARLALRGLWEEVGHSSGCFGRVVSAALPAVPAALQPWVFNPGRWPGYQLLEAWGRMFSPYQTNPGGVNALRPVVERHVDIEALRSGPLSVFVTATAVQTGAARIFTREDVTVDALLASACLPQLNQAVQIDGQPYWDGGFAGNPALWPLIYGTPALDLVLVQINPLFRAGTPRTTDEINDRLNEITFNASLVAELRAIAFVRRLVEHEQLDPTQYKALRMHRIADEDGLAPFDASSKSNTDPRFLNVLFELGRSAARRWLATDRAAVGVRPSLDIEQVFLSRPAS
jgi:NTE family protein